MSSHLRRHMDKLQRDLLTLADQVEHRLHDSIEALYAGDAARLHEIIEADSEIDAREVDLEEECLHALALYQPVAFDLRFVIAVMKINVSLERIGDLVVNISTVGRRLIQEGGVITSLFDLKDLGQQVLTMLKRAILALVHIDADLAQTIREDDNHIDQVHLQGYETAGQLMQNNPEQIRPAMKMLSLLRYIERIGDHCTNIAEDILYLSKGEIYRHKLAEDLDRNH